MTPKEKAREIVDKFYFPTIRWALKHAIDCALIAVDEIIKANPIVPLEYTLESEALDKANEYWQQVKTEIKNIQYQ